jgi:hypothetical protein
MRSVRCWLIIEAHSQGLRGCHSHGVVAVMVGIVRRTFGSSLLTVEIVMTSACISVGVPCVVYSVSWCDVTLEQCR